MNTRPLFFFVALWPNVSHGLLILEVSRSHTTTQSVGLLWMSAQQVAETSTWQHTTLTTDKHPCPHWDSNPRSQQASGRRHYTTFRNIKILIKFVVMTFDVIWTFTNYFIMIVLLHCTSGSLNLQPKDTTVWTEEVIIHYLLIKLSYQTVYFAMYDSTVNGHEAPQSLPHHGAIM